MAEAPVRRKFAVITGASSGIGFKLARQFLDSGYDILIASEEEAIHAAADHLAESGGTVQALQVDLARREGVESLYSRIEAIGQPVDAIAINAGVGVRGDFARDTSLDAELNWIDLNVRASVHLTKRVAHDMVQRGRGEILITSVASTLPGPLDAVYAASKAFLQSFAAAIRHELEDAGVTVTTLMPGPTETGFFHRAGMDEQADLAESTPR